MSEAAGNARSDDTNKLKTSILEYLYENPIRGSRFPPELENPRLLNSDPKDLRGFRNLDTADLLCPLRLRDVFLEDPMYASVSLF